MTIVDEEATQPSYFLIQSRTLGTDIVTGGANQGFWRLILNEPTTNSVYISNSRVDVYTQTPRDIQDIDVTIFRPDGTVFENAGGNFTMILEVVRLIEDGNPLEKNLIAS